MFNTSLYPTVGKLTEHQLALWPEHGRFLDKSFKGRPASVMRTSERIAKLIMALCAGSAERLDQLCLDYRFLCTEIVLPEEEFFRRNGRYRLNRFSDALSQVYANRPFMERYMNGLLLSDIFWSNHACALDRYARSFLARIPAGGSLLEIGPGHGLLMYFAARRRSVGALAAWDVSEASIGQTRHALGVMGVGKGVSLQLRNLFEAGLEPKVAGSFDAIVFSEVLEHLEQPREALAIILKLLKPSGLLWLHVPANSPAPDHLFLLTHYKQAAAILAETGYEVVQESYYPMSGMTLAQAEKRDAAVSCCIIGRRPMLVA
jgi:2-polyprenyl-3-methyl-5-hydroxy-6-metoxy-1,4-benzoquinol methylase